MKRHPKKTWSHLISHQNPRSVYMLIQSLGLIVNWFCLKTTMTFISWKQISCKARHVDQLLSVTCVWACMQKQSLAFSWLLKWLWSRSGYESWIDIFQHVWRFFLQALPEKLPPVVRNACPGCCTPPLYERKVTAHLRDSHSSQQCYRTDICAQTSPLGREEWNIQ